jgi:acetyl esterase/lipase
MPLRDEKLKVIFGGTDRPETQPIFHVLPGAPPALLMTGSRDRLVEPGNSTRLAARLIAADNAATVLTYRHVGHFAERAANAYELRNRDASQFFAAICCGARLYSCARRPIGKS